MIKLILFDCMETIVDVLKEPSINDYAWWAYHGCGYENCWHGFEAFAKEYTEVKSRAGKDQELYKETSMIDRFSLMVQRMDIKEPLAQTVVTALSENYWRNYQSNCYVDESVKTVLKILYKKYTCGVVSNFMVDGGIEELLHEHDVARYFSFIVTSIKVGWKKPHFKIYDAALDQAQLSKEHIMFVGDDYLCDYVGPLKYGFSAVHLDKKDTGRADTRIQRLPELVDLLM